MSAEKYPCIFSRQMKAIVYLCLGKPQGNQNSISSKFSVLCYTEALEMVLNICCSTIFSFSTIFSELVQNTLNWYNCNCTGLFLSTV